MHRHCVHLLVAYDHWHNESMHTPSIATEGTHMRAGLIIVGIILVVAGIWITLGNGSFKQTETVAQLGSAKIEATHTKAVPQWVGIAGIVVGGLLAVGGFASKR